jgi:hypothetical protein
MQLDAGPLNALLHHTCHILGLHRCCSLHKQKGAQPKQWCYPQVGNTVHTLTFWVAPYRLLRRVFMSCSSHVGAPLLVSPCQTAGRDTDYESTAYTVHDGILSCGTACPVRTALLMLLNTCCNDTLLGPSPEHTSNGGRETTRCRYCIGSVHLRACDSKHTGMRGHDVQQVCDRELTAVATVNWLTRIAWLPIDMPWVRGTISSIPKLMPANQPPLYDLIMSQTVGTHSRRNGAWLRLKQLFQ